MLPAVVVVSLALAASAQQAEPIPAQLPEKQLKAEYIARFPAFVEWPEEALGRQHARFVLCVAGSSPVIDSLVTIARTRRIKDRPVRFRRARVEEGLTDCHLLFIAASEAPRLSELLAATTGRPLLTVSDTSDFAERGVLINLYRENDSLRFEINLAAIRKSGLSVSSRLLQLGRPVRSKDER